MKVGTKVMFIEWKEEGDDTDVMTVVEDRGERLLVTSSHCEHFKITPTFVVRKEEVKEINL